MNRVIKAKAIEVFTIMERLFDYGKTVWVIVTGSSMYPFLREDNDMVELERTRLSKIKRGDIVLIQRLTGEYVLHRVIKKNRKDFYIVGDAQQWLEGPIQESQLKALVINIRRKNKVISCNNCIEKFFVHLWLIARPIRFKLIQMFRYTEHLFPLR